MDNLDLINSLQEINRKLQEENNLLKEENEQLIETLKKYEPNTIKNEIEEPRTLWGEGERGWGKY